MRADPLIPGKAYRVRHGKIVVDVIASNPCDAILIIAKMKGLIDEYSGRGGDDDLRGPGKDVWPPGSEP